eukprot:CAMPEP_0202726016 /NCGR_PEP_ID=MMETSP1385-20130828/184397_1 /ASSEMBLY_ACC=CAM_ASM_000861 /TAXON_ID=933848 /ORGANISM="Elphidium margaritaceum" /LENGTH=370 /DNA_ID=CAMNT_0049392227 /DNA_START=92 /DNA_END=1204 /DNA_ORIENTATION=+
MLPSTEVFDLPECLKFDMEQLMTGIDADKPDDYFLRENARLQQENHAYAQQQTQLQTEVSEWRTRCTQHEITIGQLQFRLSDQQGNFDRKFADFLRCANDYDQAKNKEVEALRARVQQLQSSLQAMQQLQHQKCDGHHGVHGHGITDYMERLSRSQLGALSSTSSGSPRASPPLSDHVSESSCPTTSLEQSPSSNLSNFTTDTATSQDCDDATTMYNKSFTVEQLKNVRIRQKNIVYVVGLPVSLCNAKLLKSNKWFGRFGAISRICFNTSPKCVKANSVPTFITYSTEEAAVEAIAKMNLYCLTDGTRLKTNYGRTKYCPMFCEQKKCFNEKCKYLHQWAKFDDIITEQEIIDFNAIRAGPPSNHHMKN